MRAGGPLLLAGGASNKGPQPSSRVFSITVTSYKRMSIDKTVVQQIDKETR